MKIAFVHAETGRYVKDFRFVVKHVYKVDYTDDLQEAYLYNKEAYEAPTKDEAPSRMQQQIKWCQVKLDQPLVPVDVVVQRV